MRRQSIPYIVVGLLALASCRAMFWEPDSYYLCGKEDLDFLDRDSAFRECDANFRKYCEVCSLSPDDFLPARICQSHCKTNVPGDFWVEYVPRENGARFMGLLLQVINGRVCSEAFDHPGATPPRGGEAAAGPPAGRR